MSRAYPGSRSPSEWDHVARLLGIPWGWKMRPLAYKEGYWRLRAWAPPKSASGGELDCGHRSIQVTARTLPLAVARMSWAVRFHQDGG